MNERSSPLQPKSSKHLFVFPRLVFLRKLLLKPLKVCLRRSQELIVVISVFVELVNST